MALRATTSEQLMSLCRRHQVARMGETHEPAGSQEASRVFQVKTKQGAVDSGTKKWDTIYVELKRI